MTTGDLENHMTFHVIKEGIEITGDIETNENIRIDGFLFGNINTKGKLVIGEKGKINGIIKCNRSIVMGTIEGKIKVEDFLSIKATAKIYGDLLAENLLIEPGSHFSGNCNMNNGHIDKKGNNLNQSRKK